MQAIATNFLQNVQESHSNTDSLRDEIDRTSTQLLEEIDLQEVTAVERNERQKKALLQKVNITRLLHNTYNLL